MNGKIRTNKLEIETTIKNTHYFADDFYTEKNTMKLTKEANTKKFIVIQKRRVKVNSVEEMPARERSGCEHHPWRANQTINVTGS